MIRFNSLSQSVGMLVTWQMARVQSKDRQQRNNDGAACEGTREQVAGKGVNDGVDSRALFIGGADESPVTGRLMGKTEKLKKKSAGYQGLVQKPEIMRKAQKQICVVEIKIYYDCYVSLDTGQWLLELYVYCTTLGEQGDAYEAVWFVHASGRMKKSKNKAK